MVSLQSTRLWRLGAAAAAAAASRPMLAFVRWTCGACGASSAGAATACGACGGARGAGKRAAGGEAAGSPGCPDSPGAKCARLEPVGAAPAVSMALSARLPLRKFHASLRELGGQPLPAGWSSAAQGAVLCRRWPSEGGAAAFAAAATAPGPARVAAFDFDGVLSKNLDYTVRFRSDNVFSPVFEATAGPVLRGLHARASGSSCSRTRS
jgi:hypothetical protein